MSRAAVISAMRVGDPALDHLLVREQGAVEPARDGTLAEHVEGALGLPEPPHAVVDPTGAESHLGEPETVALASDEVADRHPDVLVDDLAVSPVLPEVRGRVLHRRDVADNVDSRGVAPAR